MNKAVTGAEGCHFNIGTGNYQSFQEALQKGPVFTYIIANTDTLQHYKGGILKDANCYADEAKGEKRDLFVALAVGYGKDETTGQEYIKLKNSWGADWGEQGYFRIDANEPNKCGMLTRFGQFEL